MPNYKLPKEDQDYLNNYRNKDGSQLSKVQKEAMADLIVRSKFLEIGGRPAPKLELEKPKQIVKQKTVEEAIYQGRRLGFEVDTETLVETEIDLSQFKPQEVFTLKYDDFGRELIRRSNNKFRGTKSEIPAANLRPNQEIQYMNLLKRSALVTVISEDSELRNLGLYPITPLESEALLKENRLPNTGITWEDLGYLLYDHSEKGINPKEAKALYKSIKEHKQDLDLSDSDLEERLLIINAGLDVDLDFPKGVKPKIIPGATSVLVHSTLRQTGKDHKFSYGLENGLPQRLGRGNRTLWMPSQNEDIGLRVLYRNRYLDLDARYEYLDNSIENGRVTFAKKSA